MRIRSIILAAAAAFIIIYGMHASSAFFGHPLLMGGSGGGGGGGGGNTACDYGPNTTLPTGSLGADLTTAGFTHCVLNADWTDNSGAHVASGGGATNWVMNDPSTWLNQCATPSATTAEWKFWIMWGNGSSGFADIAPAPCNRVTLPVDGSTHVLSYSFSGSDIIGPSGTANQEIILYWPDCGQYCVTNFNRSLALPNAMYHEITYRLATNSLNQNNRATVLNLEDLISNNLNPGFHTAFMDPVFGEIGAGSSTSGTGATSWDNYVSGSKFATGYEGTYDYTNYHTYAWLQTTNGNYTNATAENACGYVDGTLVSLSGANQGAITNPANCAHWQNWSGAELQGHDMRQDVLIGTFCNTGASEVCSSSTLPNPMTIFIKSIRIFACANYTGVGNDCGGTLVFH